MRTLMKLVKNAEFAQQMVVKAYGWQLTRVL